MKAIFLCVWLALSGVVFAAPPAASPAPAAMYFSEVPLSTLLVFYYKHFLKENYVLSKELVGNATLVTVNLRNVDSSKYREIFERVFDQYGVKSESRDGVWYVSLVPADGRGARPVSSDAVAVDVPGGVLPGRPDRGLAGLSGLLDEASAGSRSFRGLAGANGPDLEGVDLVIYRPVGRRADELQLISNKLLGTDFKSPDKVLLRGPEKAVAKVLKLLQDYDDAPATVKVQAYLIEFSDTANKGVNFSVALTALGGKLGLALGAVNTAANNFVKFKDTNINAVVSAIDGDSRFHLVDSPTTLCDHGEACRIQVGAENPVLGSISVDRNGNPQQSIIYRDSGSILEFTPEVMRDSIRLKLRQTVSSFTKNSLSGIDSPAVLKRMLESSLTISDGDVVILGGLDQSREDNQRDGLPFLPRFLDSTSKVKQSTQLLMVLHVERMKAPKQDS